MATQSLRRTPLYASQQALGARFVDFHGWELPVQFESILREHQAVRGRMGLFDVSHMGQVFVKGPGALELLDKVNSNQIAKAVPGKGVYSHLLNERGTVVDDVIVYGLARDSYLVVVNAATREKDVAWLKGQAAGLDVELDDASERLAMLALQGPAAPALARELLPETEGLKRFGSAVSRLYAETVYVSRTGYTGEDGFEFILPSEVAPRLWDDLMAKGRHGGLAPCGLGARDTLRLEAGYLLYGSDVDEEHTPFEAGYGWVVKLEKPSFNGREALRLQQEGGLRRALTGFLLEERGVPRPGCAILAGGRKVGELSSATYSPSLSAGIGLGYAEPPLPEGAEVRIEVHGRPLRAKAVRPPFFKKK